VREVKKKKKTRALEVAIAFIYMMKNAHSLRQVHYVILQYFFVDLNVNV
jgi:hypothetical protein